MLSVSDHVVENGSLFLGTDMIQMPIFFASVVTNSLRLLRASIQILIQIENSLKILRY